MPLRVPQHQVLLGRRSHEHEGRPDLACHSHAGRNRDWRTYDVAAPVVLLGHARATTGTREPDVGAVGGRRR